MNNYGKDNFSKIHLHNWKDAWRENLRLTIFAADKIRSTFGPQGAYKIVPFIQTTFKLSEIADPKIGVEEKHIFKEAKWCLLRGKKVYKRNEKVFSQSVSFLGAYWKK